MSTKHPQVQDYPEGIRNALEGKGYKPLERVDADNAFVQWCIWHDVPPALAKNLPQALDDARAVRPKL